LKRFEINFVILQFDKLNKKGGNYDTEQEFKQSNGDRNHFKKRN